MRRLGMTLSAIGIGLAALSVGSLLLGAFVPDSDVPLYVGVVAVTLAVPALVGGLVVLGVYILLLWARS